MVKNAKKDFFATFALKIAPFSLKTCAKAHIELQQGETSITKQLPTQNYATENLFQIILQKVETSGMRGGTFAVFFLLIIQTSQSKTV